MRKFLFHLVAFAALILVTILIAITLIPYPANGYERAQTAKMGRLANPDRKPSIVLLGGSNVAFGFHSQMLQDSLHMPVINAGLHAGMGMKFIVDDCAQYLRKGDLLVFSPEITSLFENNAYGEVALAKVFFLNPGAYSHLLNRQQWWTLLANSANYVSYHVRASLAEIRKKKQTTVYYLSSFNEFGDVTWHWDNPPSSPFHIAANVQKELGKVNHSYVEYLMKQLHTLEARGVRIVMFPPAIAETAYRNDILNANWVAQSFAENGFPFICSFSETAHPDSLMYDTNYHSLKEGAIRHTQLLINLLKSKLDMP